MSVHTFPLNDERQHVTELDCWCEPEIRWLDETTGLPWSENGPLVIHHAADCREVSEEVTDESVSPDKEWEVVKV